MDELRKMIQDLLDEGGTDPDMIAADLLAAVTRAQTRELTVYGAKEMVRHVIHYDRMSTTSVSNGSGRVGRSRWTTAIDGLVCPGGKWKPLSDCDVADLILLAEYHEKLVEANAAKAREYRTLAKRLQRAGVTTVGDLSAVTA